MFAIPTKAECVSIAEFYQSDIVDFPIWVLLQYGIQILPFDKHRGGTRAAAAISLNQHLWRKWFNRLVVSQHAGLCLKKNRAMYLAKQQKRLSYAPFVHNGSLGFVLSSPEDGEMLEKYRQVVSRLSILPKESAQYEPIADNANPVDLWEGSTAIKAELEKLWLHYKVSPKCRIHHESDFYRHIIRNKIHPLAKDLNDELRRILKGQEKFLMFHLVNYSCDVFSIVGPSIVIGLDRDRPFSPSAFENQVVESVKAFIRTTQN